MLGDSCSESFFIWKYNLKQQKILNKVVNLWLNFIDWKLRNNKILNYKTPSFFKENIDQELPKEEMDLEDVLGVLKMIGEYSIAQSDVNYLAFPDSANSMPWMMWAVFSKFLNQNLIAFDRSAPIATFLEIQLIERFRFLIGYDYKKLKDVNSLSEVSWMWTTWWHLSNHIAILSALNYMFSEIKNKWLPFLKFQPVILLSKKISHYSLDAAVHHLWIWKDNIIDVPVKDDFTTDFDALEGILKSLPSNKKPFMVVSVAGNTRTTNIDNLEKMWQFCKRHGLWHHTDACHGWSLLFSKKLKKQYLKWIEEADSVTIDPHKWLFLPYSSSYVIFKRRDILTQFSRYEQECRSWNSWDLWFITPFLWSRWFDSLPIWLMIKAMWIKWIEKVILHRYNISKYWELLINNSGYFVSLNKMELYRMAFVYCPKKIRDCLNEHLDKKVEIHKLINLYTHKINQKLYVDWNVCLDEYKLHDVANNVGLSIDDRYTVMAISSWNPLTTKKSIKDSLMILFDEAKKEEKNFINDFYNIIDFNQNVTWKSYNTWPAGW